MMKDDKSNQEDKKPKGVIFKEAREAKKFSLREVQEATKIPLDVLRSIEEGYTVRTVSAFYLKGFMKMYARYLGVDVYEVVDDYHEEKLPEPSKKDNSSEKVPLNFENLFSRQRQRQMVTVVLTVGMLLGVVRIIGCIRQKAYHSSGKRKAVRSKKIRKRVNRAKEKKALSRKKKVALKLSPRAKKKVVVPKTVKAAPPKPLPPAVVQPARWKITVTVKAKRKAWMQVRADSDVVFQSTLKQGTSETWHADKEIEISGKNIYYLEFEINGKALGSLGRVDRNTRRVIITKNGLIVKK